MSADPIWSLITPTPVQVGVGLIITVLVVGCMILGRFLRRITIEDGAYGEAYAWRPLPKRSKNVDGGGDNLDDLFDGSGDGGGD